MNVQSSESEKRKQTQSFQQKLYKHITFFIASSSEKSSLTGLILPHDISRPMDLDIIT